MSAFPEDQVFAVQPDIADLLSLFGVEQVSARDGAELDLRDCVYKLFEALASKPIAETGAFSVSKDNLTYLVNSTTGNVLVTLPDAATLNGKLFIVKKTVAPNSVILTPASGTIDGAATYTLSNLNQAVIITNNGTNWFVIADNTLPSSITGPPGIPGEDGQDGEIGPPGPQGPQGPQGISGLTSFVEDGEEGPPGPPGIQGPQGPQGVQGPPGRDGEDGEDGIQGPQGVQGIQGPQGVSVVLNPDDPEIEFLLIPGPQGPQGVQGIQGPQGLEGEDGEQGPQGPVGPAGASAGLIRNPDFYVREVERGRIQGVNFFEDSFNPLRCN